VYVTHARNSRVYSPYRRVFLGETRKGSLSYLSRETSKGIGLERAICAILEDVFMSILATPGLNFHILLAILDSR